MFSQMFKAAKKVVGKDPVTKLFKEYEKIKHFQAKIDELEGTEGYEDIIEAQKDTLLNNYNNIARIYSTHNKSFAEPKSLDDIFNFIGTETKVFKCTDSYTGFNGIHILSKESINTLYINIISTTVDKLPNKFLNNDALNKKARLRIDSIVYVKIYKNIEKYCDNTSKPELLKEYILHDYGTVAIKRTLLRLNVIHSILSLSDTAEMGSKDIIVINSSMYNASDLSDVIKSLDIKSKDFILEYARI